MTITGNNQLQVCVVLTNNEDNIIIINTDYHSILAPTRIDCFFSLVINTAFCFVTISLAFHFVFTHIFLFRSSRSSQCGCQGEGDSVQLGVFDKSGCVSWAAGRTAQPRYRRYTSSFSSLWTSSSQFHFNCYSSMSGSHLGNICPWQVLRWLSNRPWPQSSRPTRRRFLLTANLYPAASLTTATRSSQVSSIFTFSSISFHCTEDNLPQRKVWQERINLHFKPLFTLLFRAINIYVMISPK